MLPHAYSQLRKLINDGEDVNRFNQHGRTLLHEAVFRRDVAAIRLLLKYGADTNIKSLDGDVTPLALCETKTIAELLLDHGADVNIVGMKTGPLHAACKSGNETLVEFYVDLVDDINQPTPFYLLTALHEACEGGNSKIVETLLEHGADVRREDHEHNTPLTRASTPEVVRLLLARGANPNAVGTINGPLHFACHHRNRPIVDFLWKAGADVNLATTQSGLTPLHAVLAGGPVKKHYNQGAAYKRARNRQTQRPDESDQVDHMPQATFSLFDGPSTSHDGAANSDDSDDDDDPIGSITSLFNLYIDINKKNMDRINQRIDTLDRINVTKIMPSLNQVFGVVESTRALTITVGNHAGRLTHLEQHEREADERFAEFQEKLSREIEAVLQELGNIRSHISQLGTTVDESYTGELQHQMNHLRDLMTKQAQLCQEIEDCLKASNEQHLGRFADLERKLGDIGRLGVELEEQLQVMTQTSLSTDTCTQLHKTIDAVHCLQADIKSLNKKFEECQCRNANSKERKKCHTARDKQQKSSTQLAQQNQHQATTHNQQNGDQQRIVRSQSAAVQQPLRKRKPALLSDPSLGLLNHIMATGLNASCELTQTTTTTIKVTNSTTTASATELHEQQPEAGFRRTQSADDIQSLHMTLRILAIVFVALVAVLLLHMWWSSK